MIVALHPGAGRGGQGQLPAGHVLDIDVVVAVGVVGVQVVGSAPEGHGVAIGRQAEGEVVAALVALDARRGGGDHRDVAGGQVLDVDVQPVVAVGRVEVCRRGDERHGAAVGRQRRRVALAPIGRDSRVGGGRQRHDSSGQVLDVRVALLVGVGRMQVAGIGQEQHAVAVSGHRRREAVVVARDAGSRGRDQGDVPGGQVLGVDVGVGEGVGVGRIEVAGLRGEGHRPPIGGQHGREAVVVALDAGVGRRGQHERVGRRRGPPDHAVHGEH